MVGVFEDANTCFFSGARTGRIMLCRDGALGSGLVRSLIALWLEYEEFLTARIGG